MMNGPESLRQKRLTRLEGIGMADPNVDPHPVVVTDGKPENWDELPAEIREESSRAMVV